MTRSNYWVAPSAWESFAIARMYDACRIGKSERCEMDVSQKLHSTESLASLFSNLSRGRSAAENRRIPWKSVQIFFGASSSRLSSRIISSEVSCFPVLTLIHRFQFHSSYRPQNPKNKIAAKGFSRTPKCVCTFERLPRLVRRCEKKEKQIFLFSVGNKIGEKIVWKKVFRFLMFSSFCLASVS